jgi:hypothetical protein
MLTFAPQKNVAHSHGTFAPALQLAARVPSFLEQVAIWLAWPRTACTMGKLQTKKLLNADIGRGEGGGRNERERETGKELGEKIFFF